MVALTFTNFNYFFLATFRIQLLLNLRNPSLINLFMAILSNKYRFYIYFPTRLSHTSNKLQLLFYGNLSDINGNLILSLPLFLHIYLCKLL